MNNKLTKLYKYYKNKYLKSKTIYFTTNSIILIMSVVLSVLTARAIQANATNPIRWLFLSIMVLNICLTFITSINSLFIFKNRIIQAQSGIEIMEDIKKNQDPNLKNIDVVDQLSKLEKEEY